MPEIGVFDTVLSHKLPFGDRSYIQGQMRKAFEQRMGLIAERVPVASKLLDALGRIDFESGYRVLGDPVVRASVQQAIAQIDGMPAVLSLEECAEVLGETVRHIEAGALGSPLASGAAHVAYLGASSCTPWIWTGERVDDIFGRSFQKLVTAEYGESLCTPSPSDLAILQKATQLLEDLFPELAHSALSHAHVLGVFPGTGSWEKVASSSQFRLTGAIFLNRKTFKNPWWLAEHVLHESLHQKLYDFRHAHSLLARDDPNASGLPASVNRVVSLWNTPGLDASNSWDPHRTIAAFHVYVHLALFCMVAEQRAPEFENVYGPLDTPPAMTNSRRAFERARYLGENLRSSCWAELGLAGQSIVEWFSAVLDALDPCPAPPGSYVHLLLDRYLMEAAKIQMKFPAPDLEAPLASLMQDEIVSTKKVLAVMAAWQETIDFSNSLARCASLQDGAAFLQVRQLVADTLFRLAPDGYTLTRPVATVTPTPEEMVREMIETSSRQLAAIGAITTRATSPVEVDLGRRI